jgi:gas vesicle protein
MEVEIKKVCEGFWNCISPDAYLQTFGTVIGSALGAFLGAFGAYLIFIKDKKNSERETKSLFKKKYLAKKEITELAIDQIENFLKNDKKSYSHTPNYKIITKITNKARDLLLTISEEFIPDNVYSNFYNLCEELSYASGLITVYEDDIDFKDLEETLKNIKLNKQELETKINL